MIKNKFCPGGTLFPFFCIFWKRVIHCKIQSKRLGPTAQLQRALGYFVRIYSKKKLVRLKMLFFAMFKKRVKFAQVPIRINFFSLQKNLSADPKGNTKRVSGKRCLETRPRTISKCTGWGVRGWGSTPSRKILELRIVLKRALSGQRIESEQFE